MVRSDLEIIVSEVGLKIYTLVESLLREQMSHIVEF